MRESGSHFCTAYLIGKQMQPKMRKATKGFSTMAAKVTAQAYY